jgi:hypothetical protein
VIAGVAPARSKNVGGRTKLAKEVADPQDGRMVEPRSDVLADVELMLFGAQGERAHLLVSGP